MPQHGSPCELNKFVLEDIRFFFFWIWFYFFLAEIRLFLKAFILVRAAVLVVSVDFLLCIKRMIFSCFWLIANIIKRAVATEPNPIESFNFLIVADFTVFDSRFSLLGQTKRFSWSDHYSHLGTPADSVFHYKVWLIRPAFVEDIITTCFEKLKIVYACKRFIIAI